MALAVGSRLGAYDILSRVGAGGMGEVYRAHDARLQRDVAIKVLPEGFSSDPERLARFEREARLLASLNHPNISGIYGVEEIPASGAGPRGIRALVMEFVDGEGLDELIRRTGRVPLADALALTRQIGDALDVAHGAGIVHRDLKPANIRLTPEGVVKVLDFGLAKGRDVPAGAGPSHSPTTIEPTIAGTLLGTAPYMSPEQARGKPVDKRADIWAFGCVLYEMLTGRRAFDGETTSDTIAAILGREPDWTALPPSTPATVRRLLRRCLERDPKQRLRDIGDARAELADAEAPASVVTGASAPGVYRWREALAWSIAAVLLTAVGVLVLRRPAGDTPTPSALVRTTIALPADLTLDTTPTAAPLAVSLDGTRIAFVGEHETGTQLYVRDLDELEPTAVPGTAGAMHPFFSPDGRWVAFFADGALKKVALAGGATQRICDIPAASVGGSWGPDDTIVFALRRAGLHTVAAAGGTARLLENSAPAAWPEILPDAQTVLYSTGVGGNVSAIAVMPLRGGERRIIARTNESSLEGPAVLGTGGLAQARYVPSGHLVYGQSPGNLRAAPFDLSSLTVTGSVVSIATSIERARNGGAVYFAVSRTGLLVFGATSEHHQLVWVDRKGDVTPISTDQRAFRHPRLSPDGGRIVIAVNDEETRLSDIWVYDAERGTRTRLTNAGHNVRPVWTPDGDRVTFSGLWEVPAGGGPRQEVGPRAAVARYPGSWSPDGRHLTFNADEATGNRLWVLPRGGEPRLLVAGAGNTSQGEFSPDGRWVAYESTESGRSNIYVSPFPDFTTRVPVSVDGGEEPRWSRDGRELFFRQRNALMAVRVDTADGFRAERPQRLFTGYFSGAGHETGFDVAPDGRRFVMVQSDEASRLDRITVVQNWGTELLARVPAAP
jgi:Tol biopolymer transport system component